MKISRHYKGIGAVVTTAMLYSFGGIYVRMIGLGFGVFNQVWVRNGLVALLVSIILLVRKQRIRIKKEDWKWLLFWGGLSAVASGGFVVSMNKLTLGTAYLVFMSCMVLGGFLSGKIWHQEKVNRVKVLSLALIVIGLALVYYKEITLGNFWYLMVAAVGGLANGFWIGVSKKMSEGYQELEVVFLDGLFSAGTTLIIALVLGEGWPVLSWSISWLGMILFVLTQIVGLVLVFYAYKVIEAQEAVLIVPLEIVFGIVIGLVIYGEVLTGLEVVGGLLILSGAVLPQVPRKWYKRLK